MVAGCAALGRRDLPCLFRSGLRVVMSATPAFDSPGVPGDDALPAELASVMRLVAGFEAGRRERAAADAAEIR
ncbi:hypothetical protein B1729_14690, partial [Microbacterium sp. B35-04]